MAAEGTEEERDYLHELQLQSNEKANATLDSTRNMVRHCEEATDSGVQTLQALDIQGQQLNRIEENMDTINEDMVEAEKNLNGMEKCCGLCALPCGKVPKFKEDLSVWKSTKTGGGGAVTSQPHNHNSSSNANSSGPQGGHIQRITNDAREDDMEENMQQVGNMLGNLRNMAIDMGTEIDTQNRQLDRVNIKAEHNEDRVTSAHKRAQKILDKK